MNKPLTTIYQLPTTSYQLLKKLRLRTKIALGVIAVLLPIIIAAAILPSSGKAEWWNNSYAYRIPITITNNTTEETNVYIAFDDTDVLDTSNTSKFQVDCGDIRFTKQNGELLPYFINSGCGTASTDIDVFFDTFPAGAQTIYMYYGNPNAANGASAEAFTAEATNYTINSIGSEETGPGPVAWWKFDDPTSIPSGGSAGQAVQDSTENDNDGVLGSTVDADSNDPSWTTEDLCISGMCLEFDGTDDYASFSNTISGIKTVSFWVRPTTDSEHIAKLTINGEISISSGTVTLGSAFTNSTIYVNGLPSSQLPATNYWSHIAITFDAMDADDVYLGYSGSDYLDGFIDEVKIYPYARSAAQVKQDYLAGVASAGAAATIGSPDTSFLSDGLVGYWKMDEVSWNGTSSEVVDSSGNGHHGTASFGGKSTGANTINTLNDTSAIWGDTDLNGQTVTITSGTGLGQNRTISSNTKTEITVSSDWSTIPDETSVYQFGGVPNISSGKFGHGGNFNGNSYISFHSDTAPVNYSDDEWSISSWIKPSSTDLSDTHSFYSASQNAGLAYGRMKIQLSNGSLRFYIGSSSPTINNLSLTSPTTITADRWLHVSVVKTGLTYTLFIDGQQVATGELGGSPGLNSDLATTIIGADFAGIANYFDGSMDEVRIYNRALSPAEVQALYNWAPGPENYLNMDEGSGTTLYDNSTNSRHGTMTGGAHGSGKYGKGVEMDGSDYIEITDY